MWKARATAPQLFWGSIGIYTLGILYNRYYATNAMRLVADARLLKESQK